MFLYDENVYHRVSRQLSGERLSVIVVLYEDDTRNWWKSIVNLAKIMAKRLNIDF